MYRRIIFLAIPTILSNLTIPLVGLVDMIIIGWFSHSQYLAAITVGGTVFSLLFWAFGFLRMGITGSLGQLIARQETVEIQELLRRYIKLAVIAGLLVLVLGNLFLSYIIAPFASDDPVYQQALHNYIRIRLWSAPFTLLNYVFLGVLLALGNARWLLLTQLTLNFSNILLSWIFAWLLQFSVVGVAIGSVLAEAVTMLLGLWVVCKSFDIKVASLFPQLTVGEIARRHRDGVKGDNLQAWLSIFTLNSNIFVRTLLLTSAFAWFTKRGVELGIVVVAVNGVLLKFVEVIAFALDGFAFSVEALAARAIGEKHWHKFVEICKKSMIVSFATAVALSILLFYFTLPLASFISTDPLVLDNISEYKNWCISLILLGVFAYLLDGIFLAAAAGRGLRNGMLFAFAIYAITLVLASSVYGNHGLWFALNILMLGRVIGLWYQFDEIKAKFA